MTEIESIHNDHTVKRFVISTTTKKINKKTMKISTQTLINDFSTRSWNNHGH